MTDYLIVCRSCTTCTFWRNTTCRYTIFYYYSKNCYSAIFFS